MKKLLLIIAFLLSAQSAEAALPKAPNNLGLVGYWSFNEGTGLKAGDSSGQGNTGTLTNGPVWSGGKLGGGLRFDGTNDYVGGTGVPVNGAPAISLSVWIKSTNTSSYIVSIPYNTGGFNGFDLRFATTVKAYLKTSNTGVDLESGVSISDGSWHHVVTTYDGASFRIYTDGVLRNTGAATGTVVVQADNEFNFGRLGTFGAYFSGSLDEVRIYNRALGANEITRLYNAGSSKLMGSTTEAGTGLIGHWKLDDRAGARALDSSGSGNNGTLTNGPAWVSARLAGGLSLDGTNDYIVTQSNTGLSSDPSVTMSAWVNLTDTTGGYVMAVGNGSVPVSNIYFYVNSTTIYAAPDEFRFIGATTTITPGQWYHVAMTKTSGTFASLKMYVNGELQTITSGNTANGTTIGAGPLYIGSKIGAATFFKGKIDDVRLYNRALTASQIKTLYTSGSSRPTTANTNSATLTAGTNLASGLVGHWTFDGKYLWGTTARDTSGSNNHGTLTNGPVPGRGMLGQGMSFDGVNDYVVTSTTTFLDDTPYSISLWINPRVVSGNHGIFGSNYGGGSTSRLYYDGVSFQYANDANTGSAGFTVPLVINTWYHVVLTSNGSLHSLYVDGVSRGTPATITDSKFVFKVFGGLSTVPDLPWSGMIDDIRIYNRALSATEVKQLYNLGK